MSERNTEFSDQRIETTYGDLICAIAEAAREAAIAEEEVHKLTHAILMNMINRKVPPNE